YAPERIELSQLVQLADGMLKRPEIPPRQSSGHEGPRRPCGQTPSESEIMTAAAVRFSTHSFSRIFSTCFSTVRMFASRITAISRLVLPRASQVATSVSRGVRAYLSRGQACRVRRPS